MKKVFSDWSDLALLVNQYFIIRHGESQANLEKLIVSSPENGLSEYGLSVCGREQVVASIQREARLSSDTIVVSSDFRRAVETAEIVVAGLGARSEVILDAKLRERCFGSLELSNTSHYPKVWAHDEKNVAHTEWGVESVIQVLDRLKRLIGDLESIYSDSQILLVSHGDILQILQAAFEEIPVSLHRSVDHLNTAEIRKINEVRSRFVVPD